MEIGSKRVKVHAKRIKIGSQRIKVHTKSMKVGSRRIKKDTKRIKIKYKKIMILPKIRDRRFITIRRGGLLTNEDHYSLAIWAAQCAEHVLCLYTNIKKDDNRPKNAIDHIKRWTDGSISVRQALNAAGTTQKAAKEIQKESMAAKFAALSAGQAAATAHVAAHYIGAAAYAIRAVMEASQKEYKQAKQEQECTWQQSIIPQKLHSLIIEDMKLRNNICWNVFLI
jgi:hypothetical protein